MTKTEEEDMEMQSKQPWGQRTGVRMAIGFTILIIIGAVIGIIYLSGGH
jgi:hypothetical protein